MRKVAVSTSIALLLAMLSVSAAGQTNRAYSKTEAEARKVVSKVLKASPIIDGHNDLFAWYFGCDYKKLPKCPQGVEDYPIDRVTKGQTDIPRWRKGGVGGVLLNVFGSDVFDASRESAFAYLLEKSYPNDLQVVTTTAGMRRAMRSGKIALLLTMEDSEKLKGDISKLDLLYNLGLRCMTFTYMTGPFGDGSDDEPRNNGLSENGKQLVKRMNDLGILIDMSHISPKTMSDILDLTKAPVIFSHSNARGLANVNRNVPDDVLLRLKTNGGMIMLDMVADHVTNQFGKWMKEGDEIYFATKKKSPDDKAFLKHIMAEWESKNPMPRVSVADVADHFDYVKKLIGVEHIGIGGDYDGMDFPIPGLEDISTFPTLLTELARRGWSEKELRQITGLNFLRVFGEIEKVSEGSKKTSRR